jgi:diguanylate cyclase (GGDEF)-like protein
VLPYRDRLTGLPNRAFFNARVDEAIRWARRRELGLVVLCLDLDRFKDLNRILGWQAGDRLLREAAGRMAGALGPCDTLARLGDDEFGALIEGTGELACATVAARRLLAQYRDPYVIDCLSVRLTASIGIGLYPTDAEDAVSLLNRADRALHKAKIDGRARCYPPC